MRRTLRRPIERLRHDALQSPDRQIRLLSILPSPEDGLAQYALQTYLLGDPKCPYFYALSYEWGSDRPTSEIAINGSLFKIRSNLSDFLELLRSQYEDFVRPLWIDAICIDQSNVAERNAQVQIMGQIFQSAYLVMTWLGKQDFDNARLMEAAESLREWEQEREYRSLTRPDSFDVVPPASETKATPRLLSTAKEYIDLWTCIRLLCEQTFWTRCWIVQEQIKAQKLLLLWGYQQMPWDTLAIAFRTVYSHIMTQPEALEQLTHWTPIISSIPYKIWLHAEGLVREHPLLELMETYRTSDCSVPHDKAYALIGISNDTELLQIDYDKSLPDLYVNLIDLIPEKSDCLKYSHLILEALKLNPAELAQESALRRHHLICDAGIAGQVMAVRRVRPEEISVMLETNIFEMLTQSGVIILPDEFETIAAWAKHAHSAFRRRHSEKTALTFFYLSNGQVGVSPIPISTEDCIYSLPGPINWPESVYLRAESGCEPLADEGSVPASPTSPSLSSPSQSTAYCEYALSPVARVWLMEPLISQSPSKETSISMPLTEVVALGPSLGFELEEAPVSPVIPKRRLSKVPSTTTRFGARSDPIGSTIDELLQSPKRLGKASTWPIDALAREMREKMFLDSTLPLNSPD